MTRDHFHDGVSEQLKWYVYRLVDPRNGGTFYVGGGPRRCQEGACGAIPG